MLGNGSQSGTPTPDAPIMPEFCGVRTGNLFDFEQLKNAPSGTIGSITFSHVLTLQLKANTYYTMASNGTGSTSSTPADLYRSIYFNATAGESSINKNNPVTLLTDSTGVVRIGFFSERTNAQQYLNGEAQLWINEGSTALPYEPYGYKIPISSANTTTPVYLGEVETTRKVKKLVLTGEEDNWGEYARADSSKVPFFPLSDFKGASKTTAYAGIICSHYDTKTQVNIQNLTSKTGIAGRTSIGIIIADESISTLADFKSYLAAQYTAGTPVTVWYVLATEETAVVNEPLMRIGDYADEVSNISIPVTAGTSTISVGTTLQPSEVTVNYKGWHPVQSVHERENGAWT